MRAFLALLLAGCYAPDYHDGAFLCDANGGRCPEGFHCAVDKTCWRNGHEPNLADGGPSDLWGPLPDARPPDGGWRLEGALATAGGGGTNSTLVLSNDGLEIADVTCNASFCLTGGITP